MCNQGHATMKRRHMLQCLGTASALALRPEWTLAIGASTAVRPLTPVFEQWPQAFAKAERERPEWALGTTDWDPLFPLVVGLGPAAEVAIDRAKADGIVHAEAGLYRTGPPVPAGVDDWLVLRMERCDSALLVIDTHDPQALTDALYWARRLAERNACFRAAILLGAHAASLDPVWRGAMQDALHGVLQVKTQGVTLGAASAVCALLPGVPYLESYLIGYDPLDVLNILGAGPDARTTAVQWHHRSMLPTGVTNACCALDPDRCNGALAWVHSGPDFSIWEFDQIAEELLGHLPDATSIVLSHFPHSHWPEERRILSLTLVGAMSSA